MGKVSKKKSRRDNRGSRRSNNDLEQSSKKQTGENSSIILTDLNSMDTKKRLTAIIMFKDLLMQNINNSPVISKLATNETLSSLSLRLIDSNSNVRFEAVKCFLAISRCGAKFTERIVSMGIHDTINKMLQEVSSSSSSSDDELVDDLLCVVHLLSSHCPLEYSICSSMLMSLAISNLSPQLQTSRRKSFAEYILNCSTNEALITSQESLWATVFNEISALVSGCHLCDTSDSTSNYLLVLLCSVQANLLCSLPCPLISHSEPHIVHILGVLNGSLRIDFNSSQGTSTGAVDAMVVDSVPAAVGGDEVSILAQQQQVRSHTMGKYETLCVKTSTDALCRLFTEKEVACDRTSSSSHSGNDNENESEGKGKKKSKSRITETLDFKRAYNRHFNEFFTRCLSCSTSIAQSSSKSPVSASMSVSVGEMEGQKGKEGEEDEKENALDVLESLLSSLCCVTDYATAHIDEKSIISALMSLTDILDALYSSFTLCLAAQATLDARVDVEEGEGEGERADRVSEELDRARYLTTSVCACVSSLLQHAPASSLLESWESDMQRLALVLIRCASSSDLDMSIPCIGSIGSLGAKIDLAESLKEKEKDKGLMPPKINWLLSNCILRTLEPYTNSTSTNNNGNGDSEPERDVFLLEVCLSSFIDLHSSDDADLLQNFLKLKAVDKLSSSLSVFEGAVKELRRDNERGAKTKSDSSSSNNDSNNSSDMREALRDFEETTLNMKSFLEYKSNYCK